GPRREGRSAWHAAGGPAAHPEPGRPDARRRAQGGRPGGLSGPPAGAVDRPVLAELPAPEQGRRGEDHRHPQEWCPHAHAAQGARGAAAPDRRPGAVTGRGREVKGRSQGEERGDIAMSTERTLASRGKDAAEKLEQRPAVAPFVDIY